MKIKCLLILLSFLLVLNVFGQTNQSVKETKVVNTVSSISITDEILKELNVLRDNPQIYLQYLESLKKTFNGNSFRNLQGHEIISIEGVRPVNEVIEILKTQKPVPEIKISNGLVKAANLHLQDMIRNSFFGHRGSNNSLPDDRAKLYGTFPNGVNENITAGTSQARDIIIQALIDDGATHRNHRKNLLNPAFIWIGIAGGESKSDGFLSVMVFSSSSIETETTTKGARKI